MAGEVARGSGGGPQGRAGPKGPAGAKGETGETGPQGPAGADGAAWYYGGDLWGSIGKDGDWYLNVHTCDVYTKVDGAWTRQVNIKGAPGPRGEKGDSLFTLQLDDDGNLWAVYADGGTPPQFEYEEDTGDLYLIVSD